MPDTDPLDLLAIRAAVDAYRQQEMPDEEPPLNLAEYAAAVLPKLCAEVEALRAEMEQAKDWARLSRRDRECRAEQVRACADLRDELRADGNDAMADRLHAALRAPWPTETALG